MPNQTAQSAPADEGKPMSNDAQRRWRERFFDTPARREQDRREALGWADPFDDCA